MKHPIQCSCGSLKGTLNTTRQINRGVCYCKDCQAFARFLRREAEILDANGGTDIIQTLPKYVRFTEGIENLACLRLTEGGLLRWYAECCNTPIGNTPANYKLSFVGLVHNCLRLGDRSLDHSFGTVCMHVHTKYAKGPDRPKQVGLIKGISRFIGMILRARMNGHYKDNPFFDAATGTTIAKPKVLSVTERKQAFDR